MLLNIFSIFIGGGIGAVLRYLTSFVYTEFFGFNFPLATLSVNLIGSFVLGVLSAFILFDYHLIPNHYKYALTVGFCGGFTTFSTFAFEVVEILKRGEYFVAILYVILSVVLSIMVAAAGFYWAKNYVYY
ncbi:MAG: fluoride efflux transporter CrcB [Candidatus Gastranaerophilaceae bacterium]